MALTNNIGFLIQHLAFTLSRQNEQILQDNLGIGVSQFKILMVLHHKQNIQQKQIAGALAQTEASISRQIKLLHEAGLLQTTVSAKNRREHITTLTTKGLKCIEQAMRLLNNHHAPMFAQLTAHQQEQLIETLRTMHDYACNTPGSMCQKFQDQ